MTNSQETEDKTYLVVWRGEGSMMTYSKVVLPEDFDDPMHVHAERWVTLAMLSEGIDEEEVQEKLEDTYDLFMVIDYPKTFYV